MKTLMNKASFAAMALVIGASALAGTASAQDNRYNGGQGGRVEHVNVAVREPAKVVVVQEPVVMHPVRRGGLFDRLDINNNGVVTKWEFTQRYGNGRMAMRTFQRIDLNHNGKLNRQEVAAGRDMLQRLPMRG